MWLISTVCGCKYVILHEFFKLANCEIFKLLCNSRFSQTMYYVCKLKRKLKFRDFIKLQMDSNIIYQTWNGQCKNENVLYFLPQLNKDNVDI